MPAIRRTNVFGTAHHWGNADLKFDLYFRNVPAPEALAYRNEL
jgi:hypothetical protein